MLMLASAKMRKSQTAVESVIMFTFMTFAVTVFMVVATSRMVEIKEQKDRDIADDLGGVIESEVNLASASQNGYSRSFTLPSTLGGINYSVLLINSTKVKANYSELVVSFVNHDFNYEKVLRLPANVSGNMNKGENNITKIKGDVCINTKSCPP